MYKRERKKERKKKKKKKREKKKKRCLQFGSPLNSNISPGSIMTVMERNRPS